MKLANSNVTEFRDTLETQAVVYEVTLTKEALESLSDYFALLHTWNERLHLVAPCSPKEFATRHVLESLLLLRHLPQSASVADIGSGAGLPIVPCLIARPDIRAILIEASKKKAVFLKEALTQTGVSNSASVIAERFENLATPDVGFVTCRALERFEDMLPRLIKWVPPANTLLLFGGERLGQKLRKAGLVSTPTLLPNSKRRFLFSVTQA